MNTDIRDRKPFTAEEKEKLGIFAIFLFFATVAIGNFWIRGMFP